MPTPPPPQIRGLTRVPTDVNFFINPHPGVRAASKSGKSSNT